MVGRPWGNEASGRLATKEKFVSKKLQATLECRQAINQKELWRLEPNLRTRADGATDSIKAAAAIQNEKAA